MKKFQRQIIFGEALILVLFAIDRLIKHWLMQAPNLKPSFFTISKNFGIAFGLPLGGAFVYILIIPVLLFLVHLSINYFQKREGGFHLALVLIIVGALSNLIDRATFGAVIDYFDVKIWPVFNLADCMIVGGVGWWAIRSWGGRAKN